MALSGGGGHHHGGHHGGYRNFPYYGYGYNPYWWGGYPYPAIVGELVSDDALDEVGEGEVDLSKAMPAREQKKETTVAGLLGAIPFNVVGGGGGGGGGGGMPQNAPPPSNPRQNLPPGGGGRQRPADPPPRQAPGLSLATCQRVRAEFVLPVTAFVQAVEAGRIADVTGQAPTIQALINRFGAYASGRMGQPIAAAQNDFNNFKRWFDRTLLAVQAYNRAVASTAQVQTVGPYVGDGTDTVPGTKDEPPVPGNDADVGIVTTDAPPIVVDPNAVPLPETGAPVGALATVQAAIQAHPVLTALGVVGVGYGVYRFWPRKKRAV